MLVTRLRVGVVEPCGACSSSVIITPVHHDTRQRRTRHQLLVATRISVALQAARCKGQSLRSQFGRVLGNKDKALQAGFALVSSRESVEIDDTSHADVGCYNTKITKRSAMSGADEFVVMVARCAHGEQGLICLTGYHDVSPDLHATLDSECGEVIL